jgi:tetratricopeptide (TPR) repeat protein
MPSKKIEKAFDICKQNRLKSQEVLWLHNLGLFFSFQNEETKALECHEKAYKMALKWKDENFDLIPAILSCQAEIHSKRGDFSVAISLHEEVLKADRDSDNLKGQAKTLFHIACLMSKLEQDESALSLLENVLKIQIEIGDAHAQAMTATWLGQLTLTVRDDIEQSLEYFYSAAEIFSRMQCFDDFQNVEERILLIEGCKEYLKLQSKN